MDEVPTHRTGSGVGQFPVVSTPMSLENEKAQDDAEQQDPPKTHHDDSILPQPPSPSYQPPRSVDRTPSPPDSKLKGAESGSQSSGPPDRLYADALNSSPTPSGRRPPTWRSWTRWRPSTPRPLRMVPGPVRRGCQSLADFASENLNFYRVHVLAFVFTPLIISLIFWGSGGHNIPYIDCLFVCVSAITVTGLATFNISVATPFQQALLFISMALGNIGTVSISMVLIRRYFFRKRFEDVVKSSERLRKHVVDVEVAHQRQRRRAVGKLKRAVGLGRSAHKASGSERDGSGTGSTGSPDDVSSRTNSTAAGDHSPRPKRKAAKPRRGALRADMIRRVDEPAVLVNPMGMPTHHHPERDVAGPADGNSLAAAGGVLGPELQDDDRTGPTWSKDVPTASGGILQTSLPMTEDPTSGDVQGTGTSAAPGVRIALPVNTEGQEAYDDMLVFRPQPRRRSLFSGEAAEGSLPTEIGRAHVRRESDPTSTLGQNGPSATVPRIRPSHDMFPRSQTVEFAGPSRVATTTGAQPYLTATGLRQRTMTHEFERTPTMMTNRSVTLRRTNTYGTPGAPMARVPTTAKERGFGGFPTPLEIAGSAMNRLLPKLRDRLDRSTTIPRTSTIASTHSVGGDSTLTTGGKVRLAPYLTFDATVTRNSRFQSLTETQREELGGVEYRAIDMLAKIVPAYLLLTMGSMFAIAAVWLATSASGRVRDVIASQGDAAPNRTWFSAFQMVSAYSNTGMSLIDTSMTKLQNEYTLLIPMGFLILAGNTAFPVVLRFFIWTISQCVPKSSRPYETLRFLLDHPRRCYVYLFPSAQTWFLLAVVVTLTCIDWVAFLVLDIGNPDIQSIPVNVRVFDGLFQSIAVRAAGFQVVSLLSLAPSVQFLYVVMMYISVFPIAMSVRNTNVYEERSLGVYSEGQMVDPDEEATPTAGSARVWGNYLAAHARRQLAFDMWWLGFALWLVCIIERDNIRDPTSNGWFTIFSCLFELTSAYGTVGLSTGTPYDNFSLSGRFRTLSKLVVIAVMLRGRHRGLPVAIDRAILLPGELESFDFEDVVSLDAGDWNILEGGDGGAGPTTAMRPPASLGPSMGAVTRSGAARSRSGSGSAALTAGAGAAGAGVSVSAAFASHRPSWMGRDTGVKEEREEGEDDEAGEGEGLKDDHAHKHDHEHDNDNDHGDEQTYDHENDEQEGEGIVHGAGER